MMVTFISETSFINLDVKLSLTKTHKSPSDKQIIL